MNETPKFSEIKKEARLGYIWDYYKLPIIATLLVLIAIVYTILHIVMTPDHYAYILAVNANMDDSVDTEHLFDDYLQKRGVNAKKEIVYVDYTLQYDVLAYEKSLYDRMTMDTLISARTCDLLITTESTFKMEAAMGVLMPISDYLTQEQMEKYKDDILWVTVKDDEMEQIACEGESMEPGTKYARGIRIRNNPYMVKPGLYSEKANIVVGIIANTKKPEIAKDLLLYLLGEE